MYLIISIIVVLIVCVISYSPKLATLRKKHEDLYGFMLTIVATFIGVFIAIDLSNMNSEKTERETAAKLIQAANTNIQHTYENIIQMKTLLFKPLPIKKITIAYDDSLFKNKLLDDHSIAEPSYFFTLVDNEIVVKHLSESGIIALYDSDELFKEYVKRISSKQSSAELETAMNEYLERLKYTSMCLKLESNFILHVIDKQEVAKMHEELAWQESGMLQTQLDSLTQLIQEDKYRGLSK